MCKQQQISEDSNLGQFKRGAQVGHQASPFRTHMPYGVNI